eukprot:424869-Rhodomonas_salina.3
MTGIGLQLTLPCFRFLHIPDQCLTPTSGGQKHQLSKFLRVFGSGDTARMPGSTLAQDTPPHSTRLGR